MIIATRSLPGDADKDERGLVFAVEPGLMTYPASIFSIATIP